MGRCYQCLQIAIHTLLYLTPLLLQAQLDNRLLEAVKNCDTQAMPQRLNSDVDIHVTDSNGANILMWAVYACDLSQVQQLVRQGAVPNDTGLIYEDAQNGIYFTSLQGIAAAKGKVELLRYLADTLHLPLDEQEYNPATRKKDSWTPLTWAVSTGQTEVVRHLVGQGVNVNIIYPEGTTPLVLAAQKEDWTVFELLLQGGAIEKLGIHADTVKAMAARLAGQETVNGNGNWNKDLALQQLVLQLKRIYFGTNHFTYAATLNHLAYLYHLMGRYDQALPFYEQASAIALSTLGETHPFYAGIIHNLAYLYRTIGQDAKTRAYLEQAAVIARKSLGERHPDYATSLVGLASFYKEQEQWEKALPLLEEAKTIREKTLGKDHSDYAGSLLELAYVYHRLSLHEKALPLYEQALEIRKRILGEEHPLYAWSLQSVALFYQDRGLYEKAQLLLKQVLALRKKILGPAHPDYAESLFRLAVLYQDRQQYDLALALFGEASTLSLQHLAQTYTTLSEQEKMALLAKNATRFSYLPSLLLTHNLRSPALLQQVYIQELVLKGMVMDDQKTVLSSIRKSGDQAALLLYEEWNRNKTLLGKQLLLPILQRVPYLDSLEEATKKMEQELSRISTAFRSRPQQHLSPDNLAQKLRKGEAAIEFIRFPIYNGKGTDSTCYAALVLLPGNRTIHFVPLFEEKRLQQLLRKTATTTSYTAVEKLYGTKKSIKSKVADSLYQLIWKPLEPYLAGVHTVHYAPTGLLHWIAFEALPLDSVHALLEKYQLNRLLSTRSLAEATSTTNRPSSVHLWGHITYSHSRDPAPYSVAGRNSGNRSFKASDRNIAPFNLYTWDTQKVRGAGSGWQPLPSTKTELDSLHKVFTEAGLRPEIFSGAAATEEAFKAISGNSPQVVHIATHGFFLPLVKSRHGGRYLDGGVPFTVQQNPLFRSGLVLAGGNAAWQGLPLKAGKEDGILIAYEIAQMDLANTELVVLSACETGLGEIQGNEGVIGLQRALKMAGVRQMVISLWQVPDKATMELMTQFYRNWLSGLSTREALRSAQLQQKEKYPHPYFWAAFVLVE